MNQPQSVQIQEKGGVGKQPDHALSQRAAWLAMMVGTFLLAWLAVGILRLPGNVALIWFADAWALAIYLSRPAREMPALMAVQALGNVLWNAFYGDPPGLIAGFALANVAEASVAAVLWRRYFTVRLVSEQPLQFVKSLLVAGVLPSVLGATLGSSLLEVFGLAPFSVVWPGWFLGDLYGYVALAMLTQMALYHRTAYVVRMPRLHHYFLMLATLAGAGWLLLNFEYPYVLVITFFMLLMVTSPPALGALGIVLLAFLFDLHLAWQWQEDFQSGTTGHLVQDLLPPLAALIILSTALSFSRASRLNRLELEKSLEERDEALHTAADLLTVRDGLLHGAKIGLVLVAKRTVVWSNQEYADIYGYALNDMAGKTAAQLFASVEEAERVGKLVYPLVSQGQAAEVVAQIRHKSGATRTVLIRGYRPEPAVDRTYFAVLDISEREAQTLQLKQALLDAQAASEAKSN
ncbi:MAG: PAS domain-containing protein, partial [Hylemonella sp.]